jgi:hypothetical protein
MDLKRQTRFLDITRIGPVGSLVNGFDNYITVQIARSTTGHTRKRRWRVLSRIAGLNLGFNSLHGDTGLARSHHIVKGPLGEYGLAG